MRSDDKTPTHIMVTRRHSDSENPEHRVVCPLLVEGMMTMSSFERAGETVIGIYRRKT